MADMSTNRRSPATAISAAWSKRCRKGVGSPCEHHASQPPWLRTSCAARRPLVEPRDIAADRTRPFPHQPTARFDAAETATPCPEPIVLTAARALPMPPSPRRRRPERTPTSLSPRLSIAALAAFRAAGRTAQPGGSTRGSRFGPLDARLLVVGWRPASRRQSHRPAFHRDYRSPAVPDPQKFGLPTALCRAAG